MLCLDRFLANQITDVTHGLAAGVFTKVSISSQEQAEADEAAKEQEQADGNAHAQQDQEGPPFVNDQEQPANPTPKYKGQDALPTSDSDTGSSKEATADECHSPCELK
jgi:hypothetical protein